MAQVRSWGWTHARSVLAVSVTRRLGGLLAAAARDAYRSGRHPETRSAPRHARLRAPPHSESRSISRKRASKRPVHPPTPFTAGLSSNWALSASYLPLTIRLRTVTVPFHLRVVNLRGSRGCRRAHPTTVRCRLANVAPAAAVSRAGSGCCLRHERHNLLLNRKDEFTSEMGRRTKGNVLYPHALKRS